MTGERRAEDLPAGSEIQTSEKLSDKDTRLQNVYAINQTEVCVFFTFNTHCGNLVEV